MSDESEKNSREPLESEPSVLDEIAAEDASHPESIPPEPPPAAPEEPGQSAEKPDAQTAVMTEDTKAEAARKYDAAHEQYRTLQEKIAEADRNVKEINAAAETETPEKENDSQVEDSDLKEGLDAAAELLAEAEAAVDEIAKLTEDSEPAENAPAQAAAVEDSAPVDEAEQSALPDEADATVDEIQEPSSEASAPAAGDNSLKSNLFGILDDAQAPSDPGDNAVPVEETPDAGGENVTVEEAEAAAEEVSEAAPDIADAAPPAEEKAEAETPRETAETVSDNAAEEAATETEADESGEAEPAKSAQPPAVDEKAPEEQPADEKETVDSAQDSTSPPPSQSSGSDDFVTDISDAPELEEMEEMPIQTASESAGFLSRFGFLSKPLAYLDRFEEILKTREDIRMAWTVFGCISLGVLGLLLIIWIFASM